MQNGPFNNLIQFLNGGGNPQQVFDMFINNNPNMNLFMQKMQNMSNGRTPKEMVMQLAKQQGIDTKQVEELAHRLGAK